MIIKDLFFIGKMFLLTLLVIVVMQIHIGDKSLEDHFHGWLKTSIIVDYIEEAIEGGKSIFQAGYKKVDLEFHSLIAKTTRHTVKKDRTPKISFKRNTQEDVDDEILPRAQGTSSKTQ